MGFNGAYIGIERDNMMIWWDLMGFDLDSTFVSDMGFDCEQLERKYPNMGSSYEVKKTLNRTIMEIWKDR
jgi:hypothetical protein